MQVEDINAIIVKEKEHDENFSAKNISDTNHTFGELYHGRMIMSAVICGLNSHLAWKSWKHDDGTMFDDMFICGVETPEGQYTNHYPAKDWDLFDIHVLSAAPKWDGHTADDVGRLLSLISG